MLRDPAFFEDPTTLLAGGGGRGEGRIGWLRSLEKMPPKNAIYSTVLSKIVVHPRTLRSLGNLVLVVVLVLESTGLYCHANGIPT